MKKMMKLRKFSIMLMLFGFALTSFCRIAQHTTGSEKSNFSIEAGYQNKKEVVKTKLYNFKTKRIYNKI